MVVQDTSHNDIRPLKKIFKSERCAQPCAEMARILSVCLHEVVRKILISSFQLHEGRNRKTIL